MTDEQSNSTQIAQLVEWSSNNPLHRHLGLAPIGTLITTSLLLWFSGGQWQWWSCPFCLVNAGQTVPLEAIVYGTVAATLDVGGKMIFYALASRKREIEKRREEGRVEGREEGENKIIRVLLERNVSLPDDIRARLNGNGKNGSTSK